MAALGSASTPRSQAPTTQPCLRTVDAASEIPRLVPCAISSIDSTQLAGRLRETEEAAEVEGRYRVSALLRLKSAPGPAVARMAGSSGCTATRSSRGADRPECARRLGREAPLHCIDRTSRRQPRSSPRASRRAACPHARLVALVCPKTVGSSSKAVLGVA